jgi:nicotinamide-nucleotide amidase
MLSIIKNIGEILTARKWTLATAESCTGGLISAAITDMAGSSQFFKGSVIAYDNIVKMSLLNVSESTLVSYGAVSSQTVEAMANGICNRLQTECALSVSGIAGPGGGTAEKPVGLVYIGLKIKDRIQSFEHYYEGNRRQIRNAVVNCALLHLLINLQ